MFSVIDSYVGRYVWKLSMDYFISAWYAESAIKARFPGQFSTHRLKCKVLVSGHVTETMYFTVCQFKRS